MKRHIETSKKIAKILFYTIAPIGIYTFSIGFIFLSNVFLRAQYTGYSQVFFGIGISALIVGTIVIILQTTIFLMENKISFDYIKKIKFDAIKMYLIFESQNIKIFVIFLHQILKPILKRVSRFKLPKTFLTSQGSGKNLPS